ncbi:hypothetical protein [Kiloniella antarctica]|uniref:Glycosyl transferase family 28 C-terminal domain-containing protein n=1 Tax=Kiloniella antarctica TaxID=1550907 RepID=A0ABW5BPR6_9PROT
MTPCCKLHPVALFLVECGQKNGLGHLRRCQVLAHAMQAEGWECSFGISDVAMIDIVCSEGFKAALWVGDGLDLGPADVLLVDGYHYNTRIFSRWKKYTRVSLAVDDLAERPVSAHVILNHNLYGTELDYSNYGAEIVIGGGDYSLVDKKFFAVANSKRPSPLHVLVSFGGMDDGCYSVPVAKRILMESPSAVLEIVIPKIQTPSEGIQDLQRQYGSRVILHHGVDMAEAMGRCSVLAGAAGVTVLEALASGLKLSVCASADNQRINTVALRKLGYTSFDGFDPEAVAKSALTFLKDGDLSVCSVLDGKGPERVISTLVKLLNKYR